ncbi:MAG: hypothetical protein N2039_08710 [Gemmataceae bacterium]|nr:hypothetical protein [Gemmataceae bacterium]
MSRTDPIDSVSSTSGQRSSRRSRRGDRAAAEAVLTLTIPIANWQAKWGWACAMWGLIPVLGLPLGLAAVILGMIGYRRVRRKPEDLGVRHAVGAIIMGSIELAVNSVGLACIVKGILTLQAA